MEGFTVHPEALLGFIRILVSIYAISSLLLAILPWASAALTSFGVAILVHRVLPLQGLSDPFFPGLEGINVIGTIEPQGRGRDAKSSSRGTTTLRASSISSSTGPSSTTPPL